MMRRHTCHSKPLKRVQSPIRNPPSDPPKNPNTPFFEKLKLKMQKIAQLEVHPHEWKEKGVRPIVQGGPLLRAVYSQGGALRLHALNTMIMGQIKDEPSSSSQVGENLPQRILKILK